jgi:hypothetical protein
MGTGVTLPTKSPENLKELPRREGFENRIVTALLLYKTRNFLLLESKFYGQALGTLVLVN